MMMSDLAAFLANYVPQAEGTAVWGAGTIPLRLRAYLGQTPPPLGYVTSARCLVFRKSLGQMMCPQIATYPWPNRDHVGSG